VSEHSIHRSMPATLYTVQRLRPGDAGFPAGAAMWRTWCEGEGLFESSAELFSLGMPAPLLRPTVGLICSRNCPGAIVLETYALVRRLPVTGPTIVGGFQSPMEKTCFETLLLRSLPVVYCPGRRLSARGLPLPWKQAMAEQRLVLLSPFAENHRRVDRELARLRNVFVAAIVDRLFVPYARDKGDVASLARLACAHGKRVLTFCAPENGELIRGGAEGKTPAALFTELSQGEERR
jgi:predicted Rossmann fold nucleotide-binding protein DprA/Smf involved in DNA uptake